MTNVATFPPFNFVSSLMRIFCKCLGIVDSSWSLDSSSIGKEFEPVENTMLSSDRSLSDFFFMNQH